MKILSRAAAAGALLLFLGVMSTGYTLAQSAGTPLVLKLANRADSSRYPDISVSLSAVDALGRPLDVLTAADVVATDDIGAVEVRDVGPRVDAATRVAWVILVDTSGSMTDRRGDGSTYIDGARGFVNQVLGQLGDGDVARLVVFNEGTTSLTNWRPKTDGMLKNAANTIQASAKRTFLSSALADASTMAANPPSGYDRRAIVLVTDMDSRDRDDSLSLDAIRSTLGAPIYAKLDQDIASNLMSINAVKGVEIGNGFEAARITGEQNADEMRMGNDGKPIFLSNHAGGILGGISTGQPVVARFAVKPTSSILTPRLSIDRDGNNVEVMTKGRHDPCVGIRAVPIGEAMVACAIADHYLRHRGQTGKSSE